MRNWLPALLFAASLGGLAACGGTPERPNTVTPEPLELPDGRGTWTVRHNPPKCLATDVRSTDR